jgi:hypothetical protein
VRERLVGQPAVPMLGEMQVGDVKNFHGVSPRRVRSVTGWTHRRVEGGEGIRATARS